MTTTVWAVLQQILRDDAAAPRVTFYERTPGATQGERIELSGKVLVNWVSKAANLLSEEFDAAPGTRIGVHLPAAHWRTVYWCLAAWSVGAEVHFVDADDSDGRAPEDVDVLVTCVPVPDLGGEQIVVTLAMLARSASAPLPSGALDEAKQLSTYADVFTPFDDPAGGDVALVSDARSMTFRDLVTAGSPGRRYLPEPSPTSVVQSLSAGGSVVLVRGDVSEEDLAGLLTQESAERH